MQSTISDLLADIRLGEPVIDEGLTLIPIFGGFSGAPKFQTLAEALSAGTLVVTEKDTGGSVPELRARNEGKIGVLILDGEELSGAKQNRVLNTSVFLKPNTEIHIPVSCVEQGRWNYVSDKFADSGNVAAQKVRQAAHASVTASVRDRGSYRSDQGKVWSEVAKLQDRHGIDSCTSAMSDVYIQREDILRQRHEKFAIQPEQTGLFAVWGGKVAGFDAVATAEAYVHLHERLVRSYALDTLAEDALAGADDLRTAKEFLVSLADAESTEHDSPGDGASHRYTGAGFVGSALTVDDAILHAVFFGVDAAVESPDVPPFRSARERRDRFTR